LYNRKGSSSVISTVIMVAVVISIGIGIQGMASSAATIMRSDYFDNVMDSVYHIKERFRIENIAVNLTEESSLQVWVVNYGDYKVNITTIKVSGGGNEYYYYPPDNNEITAPNGIIMESDDFRKFHLSQVTEVSRKGMSISVMVESSSGNKAYERTQLP